MSGLGVVPRYALITTHNRPDELARLVQCLQGQTDYITIVDNASDPPVDEKIFDEFTHVLRDEQQPPNLYKLWNKGLTDIKRHCHFTSTNAWDVAVFNDDTIIPQGWWDAVSEVMRLGTYAAASGDTLGVVREVTALTLPDGNITHRMCPWAFMMRGELGIRADERYGWWWGDTDLDWQLRQRGGLALVPGMLTQNTLANSTTVGALAAQAGRDGESFALKWGACPW